MLNTKKLLAFSLLLNPLVGSRAQTTSFVVGGSPKDIAFDGTYVWIANGNGITKLRSSDGANFGTVPIGDSYGVAFDGSSIWVTPYGGVGITKVRVSDGAVLGTFPAGDDPLGVAYDGANVWVANGVSNNITKLRASDGAVLATVAAGNSPREIAFDGSNIWVTNNYDDTVTKLRASDGTNLGTFPVGSGPLGIVFDGVNIWVANYTGNTITELHTDGTTLGTFPCGDHPVGLAFDGTDIWVADTSGPTGGQVTEVRPFDGSTVAVFSVGGNPWGAVFDGSRIWVSNSGANNVFEIPDPILIGSSSQLNFAFNTGGAAPSAQSVSLMSSSGVALTFTVTSMSLGGNWLFVNPTTATTPANVNISVTPFGLAPGTYSGTVEVNATGASASALRISISLMVVQSPPSISIVGNAASGTAPFAAGQLISIYGSQLGPATGVSAQLGATLVVGSSVGGTNVLFDGIAAPILFARSDIVNTAIPCEVAGHPSTQLVVEYLGVQSAPLTIPLVPAAPAIFTADSSGKGQALVFNSDFSQNSSTNPAARGSEVFFYATGLGAMSPTCVDGEVYTSNFPSATLPVVAGVGNVGAQVLYAGQAPDLMAGVAQINIVIPNDTATSVVPLTLLVNGVFSPPGVTIAVK